MADIWDDAADRAERAEHKPGITPYRRGLIRIFVEPLTAVIAAKLEDKPHLPHGRLGTLLQALESGALALMALDAVVSQIGVRRSRSPEMLLRENIGEIFYANVLLTDRRSKLVLRGKLKPARHESPKAWRARLRRRKFRIWQSITGHASRRECLHAGSWLLGCVIEADIVVLADKQLLPADQYRDDIKKLQAWIVRANVRLLPLRDGPPPWSKPVKYHSGKEIRLLPHWNPAFQDKMEDSFRSKRFRHQHLAAVNTAADVQLCVDPWTLDLVRRFAPLVKRYKDADRRIADESLIARDIKTAEILARRGRFKNGYHIDPRGRLYADEHFNFAQQDRIRSLFRFAHGAVLGPNGLRWLKIHAAN